MKQPQHKPAIHLQPYIEDPEWLAAAAESTLVTQSTLGKLPTVPYLELSDSQRMMLEILMPTMLKLEECTTRIPSEVLREITRMATTGNDEVQKLDRMWTTDMHKERNAIVLQSPGYYNRKTWLVATWGLTIDWVFIEQMAKETWLKSTKDHLRKIQRQVTTDLELLDSMVDGVFAKGRLTKVSYDPILD